MKILACAILFAAGITYASNFNEIAPMIVKWEGKGYHNHPNDPGGPTAYGWTLKTYRLTVNKNATIQDLQNLTEERAMALYDKYWWQRYGANKIEPDKLAYTLLLAQINLGPYRPNKLLQEVVNDICDFKNVPEDGKIGSSTIMVVNKCSSMWPAYPYILFYLYSSSPAIDSVWKWAKKGLRSRVFQYLTFPLER